MHGPLTLLNCMFLKAHLDPFAPTDEELEEWLRGLPKGTNSSQVVKKDRAYCMVR